MRTFLFTILCLCSLLSAAAAAEEPLRLGVLRGPYHDAAIVFAREFSETLKRPVIIKAFEDEATMYAWLDRYRMIDFALSPAAGSTPGNFHRLGQMPVADGTVSAVLIGHWDLSKEVLQGTRALLAGEDRTPAVAAQPTEPEHKKISPSEPVTPDPAPLSEAAPLPSPEVVEPAQDPSKEQDSLEGVGGLLSHWGLSTEEPQGEETLPADEDPMPETEALASNLESEVAATTDTPVSALTGAPSPTPEDQTSLGSVSDLLSHWGLSAEKPQESETLPVDEAQMPEPATLASEPESEEIVATAKPAAVATAPSPDAAETAQGGPAGQSNWGGITDLLNHWGLAAEKPQEQAAADQPDLVGTVVMNEPQPQAVGGAASIVEPSGPLVMHLIPLMRVMIPERVENRLLEEFGRLLQQQEQPDELQFVEVAKPFSQIEPAWLKSRHSLTGEVFGYMEDPGTFATRLRVRGRLYYRPPEEAGSPWQEEALVKVSFDPDKSSLEEAQDQLADALAAALLEVFLEESSL